MSDVGGLLSPLGPQDPREVAGYRLVARIGEGGMGTVYLSYTRGGQPVALKVIRREYGQNPDFRRRFEQEVQAARRVQGYHIVPVVDHDTSGELPWLASTFIPGIPLHEALAGYGPLPLSSVHQLVGGAARALTAIHAVDVVHRDLKPSNILLGPAGPYVIDFGIARAADATQLTQSGGLVGTPQYMSPEHALGERVGPATDVFSLGLIAAVAATGRHPYGDGGAITVAAQIANSAHRPPDLSSYPEELRELLQRCLAPNPAERISTEELTARCHEAASRPPGYLGEWPPEPLRAEIARREESVHTPPPPAGPQLPATGRDAVRPGATPTASATAAFGPTTAPGTSGTPGPPEAPGTSDAYATPGAFGPPGAPAHTHSATGSPAHGYPAPASRGPGYGLPSASPGAVGEFGAATGQHGAVGPFGQGRVDSSGSGDGPASGGRPRRRLRTALLAAALVAVVAVGAGTAVWLFGRDKDTGGTGVHHGYQGPITGPDGKCVGVGGHEAGTEGPVVELQDCRPDAKDQQWRHNTDGTLSTKGRCLDIVGNSTTSGTAVQLWVCNNVGGQEWQQYADGSLRNPQSGLCLDTPDGNTANGTNLRIWDCNSLAAQKFTLAQSSGSTGR